MPGEPLVCPSCASTHPLDERFCPSCGMPLVYAGATGVDQPVTERQAKARKIKPQYSEGELVKVAAGRNQAEAELIQGLLLEEGVPSMLKRSRGFDVPDMLAAGPRDVLLQAELLQEPGEATGVDRPSRVLAVLLAAVVLVAVIAWLGTEVLV